MLLPRQTSGKLVGYPILDIDLDKYHAYLAKAIALKIKYGLGAKDPHIGTFPPDYKAIDCSGFVRTVLAYCTTLETVHLALPDGSWNEDSWCIMQGFKNTDYRNGELHDNILRLGIHRPGGRGGDSTGHAWFILNGMSGESYGGHGPGSRSWDHQWFLDHVDDFFVLGGQV